MCLLKILKYIFNLQVPKHIVNRQRFLWHLRYLQMYRIFSLHVCKWFKYSSCNVFLCSVYVQMWVGILCLGLSPQYVFPQNVFSVSMSISVFPHMCFLIYMFSVSVFISVFPHNVLPHVCSV